MPLQHDDDSSLKWKRIHGGESLCKLLWVVGPNRGGADCSHRRKDESWMHLLISADAMVG